MLDSACSFFSSPSILQHFTDPISHPFRVVQPTDSIGWRTQAKLATSPANPYMGGVKFGLYKARSHIVEVRFLTRIVNSNRVRLLFPILTATPIPAQPIPECLVHHPRINAAVEILEKATVKCKTTAYVDPGEDRRGGWREATAAYRISLFKTRTFISSLLSSPYQLGCSRRPFSALASLAPSHIPSTTIANNLLLVASLLTPFSILAEEGEEEQGRSEHRKLKGRGGHA